MKDKIKKLIIPVLAAAFILVFTVIGLVTPDKTFSSTERRTMTQFPTFDFGNIQSGKFMSRFENYALDQFPLRDTFRSLKAYFVKYVLREKVNNDIYLEDGFLSKVEYPLKDTAVSYAGSRFQLVMDKYLQGTDCNAYVSIIPDKNYFMAEKNGYLALDYDKMVETIKSSAPGATYINIFDKLQLEDYYKTDTHWRQEHITNVAAYLISQMNGAALSGHYDKNLASDDFHGVYYGQAALNLKGEPIYYLTNDILNACTVYNGETDKDTTMYNMDMLETYDYYQMYLSGSVSLLKITNPNATTDRNLILFRDSFGSSIAPLLAEGYATVTIVDIRYISPMVIGNFVDFDNADVLFLYSALVLNNGTSLK